MKVLLAGLQFRWSGNISVSPSHKQKPGVTLVNVLFLPSFFFYPPPPPRFSSSSSSFYHTYRGARGGHWGKIVFPCIAIILIGNVWRGIHMALSFSYLPIRIIAMEIRSFFPVHGRSFLYRQWIYCIWPELPLATFDAIWRHAYDASLEFWDDSPSNCKQHIIY